jgi:hypothetical protein
MAVALAGRLDGAAAPEEEGQIEPCSEPNKEEDKADYLMASNPPVKFFLPRILTFLLP